MKKYIENDMGLFNIDGKVIPKAKGNKDYQKMLKEIKEKKADIIYYEAPIIDPNVEIENQIRKLKSENLNDVMIAFMDGNDKSFKEFKKTIDKLKSKLGE